MNAQLKPAEPRGIILLDEPAEVYHQRVLGVANCGGLKIIDQQSPAHYAHWIADPEAGIETPALRFGKALHCAVLEPDVFARTYCVLPQDAPQRPTDAMRNAKTPSESSVARVEWWDSWDAEHAGAIMLSAADYDRVQGMAASARRHPVTAAMLDGGQREVTMRWTEAVELPDGDVVDVPCKIRVDVWHKSLRYFMDLKSTADASPEGFSRSVASYRYHVQHCHYSEGAKACGIDLRAFLFLAIESVAPFVVAPYGIDAAAEERGYQLRERAMQRLAVCTRANLWPGYSDQVTELSIPGWAFY